MKNGELERRFVFHPVKGDQAERYQALREQLLKTAKLIEELTPESREQSLAFTNLEQAGFWANAAIARNELEE